jgi:uracil-DNA glycosylase
MDWNDLFSEIKNKEYSKKLNTFLDNEYKTKVIYPPREKMFNAFKLTPLDEVKVVILGQDPYHEPNQAMGLAFSVPRGIILPPTLENIYREIENEYHTKMDHTNGDLTYLAKQGVLLINPILTVVEHRPLSHKCKEYELFFNDVMNKLNLLDKPLVFLLWGNNARQFKYLLTNPNHLILESVHPSPLSANRGGWFNNNHFIKANEYLVKNKEQPINWLNK